MSPKAFFIAFKAVCNERMKGKSVMPTVLPLGLCAFVMCLCTHKSGPVNSGHDPSHPSAWPLYMVSPLCCASFHIPINVTGTSRHRQQPIWGGGYVLDPCTCWQNPRKHILLHSFLGPFWVQHAVCVWSCMYRMCLKGLLPVSQSKASILYAYCSI